MNPQESMLLEFDQEMKKTRIALERIPDEKLAWKPHDKSWSFGELATHIVNLPTWVPYTLKEDSWDMAPPGQSPVKVSPFTSKEEALQKFDENITKARVALSDATNDVFSSPWTLLAGGKKIFTLPKIAVLRSFVFNHIIHHRAQLGIYLRLNDLPVPATYGPSADEK